MGRLLRMLMMCLWISGLSLVRFLGVMVGVIVLCWCVCLGLLSWMKFLIFIVFLIVFGLMIEMLLLVLEE